MRISDWSSDVCSSDLRLLPEAHRLRLEPRAERRSGDVPGGDRRSLEADQLQLPVFPGRSAGDPALAHRGGGDRRREIGRATCRERVCQYVQMSVVAVSLKKKSP